MDRGNCQATIHWGHKESYTNEGNKTTAQNGVTYANPCITKLRPDDSFSSPRNGILNQSVRNNLVSTSYVTYFLDP